jgi:hypothetical protein
MIQNCKNCKNYPWLRTFVPDSLPLEHCRGQQDSPSRRWTERSRDDPNDLHCFQPMETEAESPAS